MKHPPSPIYVDIFSTLHQRKLVKDHADFMKRYAGRSKAGWHIPASAATLTRLWLGLNAHGQHDLAVIAHKALLATAAA